jgi:glutaredoxin
MGIEIISVIMAAAGMTGICPQCKSLIPRGSSRSCNYCGMALRTLSDTPGEEDQVDHYAVERTERQY